MSVDKISPLCSQISMEQHKLRELVADYDQFKADWSNFARKYLAEASSIVSKEATLQSCMNPLKVSPELTWTVASL